MAEPAPAAAAAAAGTRTPAIEVKDLSLWYGSFKALHEVDLVVEQGLVTALIGPSGCGKSTLLRCCNRINERLGYVTTTGTIKVLGHDVYAESSSRIQVRRHVGMVFQRPNPLPLSIRDNVLFSHRLHHKATGLSLEEQQKLCIARLLPTRPAVLLMDEPCSALDPEATSAVEDLLWDLRGNYSILIVTHNMAQARRASDQCVFMLMGRVVEHAATETMFVSPARQETADYVEGRFG